MGWCIQGIARRRPVQLKRWVRGRYIRDKVRKGNKNQIMKDLQIINKTLVFHI